MSDASEKSIFSGNEGQLVPMTLSCRLLGLGVDGISLLEEGIHSSLDNSNSCIWSEEGTSGKTISASTSGSAVVSITGLVRGGDEGGKSSDFQSNRCRGLGVVGVAGRLNTKSSSLAIGKLFERQSESEDSESLLEGPAGILDLFLRYVGLGEGGMSKPGNLCASLPTDATQGEGVNREDDDSSVSMP